MPVTAFAKISTPVDTALAKDQLTGLQTILKNYGLRYFCQQLIWILKKKKSKKILKGHPQNFWNKRLIPFRFNRMQDDLHNLEALRNIIVKMRQGGLTTDRSLTRLYIPTIMEPGTSSLLISQTKGYAVQHFQIVKRAHKLFAKVDPFNDMHPDNLFWQQVHEHLLHTQYSPRHELVFDFLDSRMLVDTAENTEVGQGLPGISHLLCSEVARWPHIPEETMANVKESVHDEGTIDLESTPNGMGGYFHEEYNRSKNEVDAEFKGFFYPWWWMDGNDDEDYRDPKPADKTTLIEEELELMKQFKLDLYQITWRRKKIIALRREFKEKYPEDDVTCFLTSGSTFFDTEPLAVRLRQLVNEAPMHHEAVEDGYLELYRRRIPGRRYLGFGDLARGIMVTGEDTDFCAAVFIDVETGEDVASIRCRIAPEDFGKLMVAVAKLFNNAMLAVERTGDGHSCMIAFREARYYHIYEHKTWDKKNRKVINLPGWPATMITRPMACNRLAMYVREHSENFRDRKFLEEAITFIRDKMGRPAGAPGCHDDTVTAHYGAHYVRLVMLGFIDPLQVERERYGETELERI